MKPPPTTTGVLPRGPAPYGWHALGLQVKTCSLSCSYRLHTLRSWSLRQTRCGSRLIKHIKKDAGGRHQGDATARSASRKGLATMVPAASKTKAPTSPIEVVFLLSAATKSVPNRARDAYRSCPRPSDPWTDVISTTRTPSFIAASLTSGSSMSIRPTRAHSPLMKLEAERARSAFETRTVIGVFIFPISLN